MTNYSKKPLELNTPRAWRTYLGGAMIDKLHGVQQMQDEHFPEEWIMSVISARNPGREHITDEGMAYLKNEEGVSLKDLIANDPEGIDKMAAMIKAIMTTGNTLLNINIIDTDKILEAHKDPMKYPDLVVRVTGFTAYFAMLSPEFRQLVVDRITSVNTRQLKDKE